MPAALQLSGQRIGSLIVIERSHKDEKHAWMWRAMLARCEYENHGAWPQYGGRGIKVCDSWHDFAAFERDMGPTFDPVLELDRIDVNGHYEPSNCRWITHQQQQVNKRRNHVITWRGQSRTVVEWARVLGFKTNTLVYRLRREWPLERAMTQDVDESVLLEIANA